MNAVYFVTQKLGKMGKWVKGKGKVTKLIIVRSFYAQLL